MKALGVLGLCAFTAAFWATVIVLACGGREADVAKPEPVVEERGSQSTNALLEFTFPVEERAEEQAAGPDCILELEEPPAPQEDTSDSSTMSVGAFLSDPLVIEGMHRVEAIRLSKLGPDGRLKPEEAKKQVATQEYTYLHPVGDDGQALPALLSRPLLPEERTILEEEARNGWYVPYGKGERNLTACWEWHLKEWGILIPGTPDE